MKNFEDFLSEGKKLQIKRKYTENHPAQTVGKTANVRNAVLQAIKDGVVTREDFNKILSELSTSSSQWASRNRKYFNVSEEGVKLSKWGRRILAELDETPKAAEVFEATVEMDAINPDDKDFLKFLKKNKVKIINKEMDGPGGGHPVITMQGKRKDLEKVLADPELGWDDPDLAEYIEESVNENIKVTKDKWPNAVVKYKGKKYEIEFDDYDVIDDHGNEGKDLYFMGVDQEGGNWEVDVYADYRDEVEEVHWETLIYKGIDESVVTEAKFVKDFDKDVLDAETKADITTYYPSAQFFIGKLTHFFGELEPNLFFKAQYAKYYKEDTGKSIKGDFKITSIYSEKGRNYVHLYNESVVTENYEVIYSDGVSAMKKFRNEKQALDFMEKEIASNKKLRDIAVYKPGMHSTTQTELVVKFWGDGSYLDNVSKRDKDLASKKLQENTNMKNTFSIHESFASFTGASGFLNEALGSQILASILMGNKEGKHGKENLKRLASGFYQMTKVALDKIQDEDFLVDNDPQKAFKNHGGSKNIIFFISDNEKENPYLPSDSGSYGSLATIPGGGILLAAMGGDREFYTNDWSRYSKNRAWKKDGKKGSPDQIGVNKKYRGWGASGLNNGKRISEVSDRVIIVNLDLIRQKYSTQQLRDARASAKAGATAFKSDKDFKADNNNRYHKILATKAASLPIDKMVADAIDLLANQIKEGLAKGDKTRYEEIKIGENAKGKEVKLRDASNHMSNILDNYSRYCDYIRQGEESKERYGQAESYYERESKNYAKEIKDQISKIKGFDYAW